MRKPLVNLQITEDVALLTFDDGKANALGFDAIEQLIDALDEAEENASAVVMAGRTGFFCAGFDLGVMRKGGEAMAELLDRGTELLKRLLSFPLLTVAACTGHAIAGGALLLLAVDDRIGTPGQFRIGLNEVAIGLPLPAFAIEMARLRLNRRHLVAACNTSRMFSPFDAVEAGFLDRLSYENTIEEACTAASELAKSLDRDAFAATRIRTHGSLLASFDCESDLGGFTPK